MKTKTTIISLYLVLCTLYLSSQNVVVTDDDAHIANSSAMLDVYSVTKGMLIPQISLTGVNDATTITTPATSLLVYNTATVTGLTPGYYYNTGTTVAPVWTRLASGITEGTVAGQMLYWNGTAWMTVSPGTNGAILTFVSGVPKWKAISDVVNLTTGEIWMDRNLGASQVATSSTDAASYGDLYQWGRLTDGHEIRTSGTTSTLSNTNPPLHSNFIINTTSPYDWLISPNVNLWQGVSGTNNPCPSGYRLPTEAELLAEVGSWSSNDAAGAFASPLKLPVAGQRYGGSGLIFYDGFSGYYWSSTVISTKSRGLCFGSGTMSDYNRTDGCSVRCIKD